MTTGPSSNASRQRCATHGLVYDASLHSGCVLCRNQRAAQAPAVPSAPAGGGVLRLLIAAVVISAMLGGGVAWLKRRATHAEPPAGLALAFAEPGNACVRDAAQRLESCVASPTPQPGTGPYTCLAAFAQALSPCALHASPGAGSSEQLYASTGAPPWLLLHAALRTQTGLGPACGGSSVAYVRIAQPASGPTSSLPYSSEPHVEACLRQWLSTIILPAPSSAPSQPTAATAGPEYFFVLRLTPSQPPPVVVDKRVVPQTAAASAHGAQRSYDPSRDLGTETNVHDAVKARSQKSLEALVAGGRSLDERDSLGRTPLSIALDRGDGETALWLIDKGASVPAKGVALIPEPEPTGWEEVLGVLLAHGANLGDGASWLVRALGHGNEKEASLLLEHGAPIDGSDQYGNTPLMSLVASHATPISPFPHLVQWVLDHGATLEAENLAGDTATYQAAIGPSADILHLLLLNGADVQKRPVSAKYGPMNSMLVHAAIASEGWDHKAGTQEEQVRLLLMAGADPHELPARRERQGDLNVKYSLVEEAVGHGRVTTPFVQAVDLAGNTQLHYAVTMNEASLVTKLLAAGLEVGALSRGPGPWAGGYEAGSTPLHLAAAYCYPALVAILLAHGARMAADGRQRTPAEVACSLSEWSHAAKPDDGRPQRRARVDSLLSDAAARP